MFYFFLNNDIHFYIYIPNQNMLSSILLFKNQISKDKNSLVINK